MAKSGSKKLVALNFPSSSEAHEAFIAIRAAAKIDPNITIIDAAFAHRSGKHVRLEQFYDVEAGKGAVGGGMIGFLVGLSIGGPIGAGIGALAGGVVSGIYSAMRDIGVDDKFMRGAASEAPDGSTTLFLLFEGEVDPSAVGILRDYSAQLSYSTMPQDINGWLRDQLSSAIETVENATELDVDLVDEDETAPAPTPPAQPPTSTTPPIVPPTNTI